MNINKNTKFLLEEHYNEKAYDTMPLNITTTKQVQENIHLVSEELNIDYDDAMSLLVLVGTQHIYDK